MHSDDPTLSHAAPHKSVYLSGPISGLNYEDGMAWREYARHALAPDIIAYSPLRGHEQLALAGIIRDSYEDFPLLGAQGLTARDRFDCAACDLLLVNLLGATEVSIGTCLELGWADAFRKPIVLVMEPSGNCHNHPLVRGVAAFRSSLWTRG